MATLMTKATGRGIETLFRLGVTGSMNDAQLIELFLSGRDGRAEDAFAAIVERHGPMVWRVCRRILIDPNDAEDGFQVTFLVLARKARSIGRRELLPGWLHGVALRSARELKKKAARRRSAEARMGTMPRSQSAEGAALDGALESLDLELAKLPNIYRAAIILCDLEGMTHSQAAQRLGVPVGTIASRLARGRERLRDRLSRQGVGVSPGLVAIAFAKNAELAPPRLVAGTVETAGRLIAGEAIKQFVPAPLETLAVNVSRAMLIAKLAARTSIACGILAVSLGATAVGVASVRDGASGFLRAGRKQVSPIPPWSELSWIDDLKNADPATKVRLKRCLSSALANFAAIHRAIYDFDFRQETAELDRAGEPRSVAGRSYHGKLYWQDGSARYELFGPPPVTQIDEQGRPLPRNLKTFRFEVSRTPKIVTISDLDLFGNLDVRTQAAPESIQLWKERYSSQFSHLDPLVFYAKSFRTDERNFRAHCESMQAIQSAEGSGTIVLRFRRQDDAKIEIICNKAADCLPTRSRVGSDRRGEWVTWGEESCEWQKIDGAWFPAHQVATGYIGKAQAPVKFFEITIRNARFNDHADVPESIFEPRSKFPGGSDDAARPKPSGAVRL
jgi:RNA polymerase sigma factor (sigma-70 family)